MIQKNLTFKTDQLSLSLNRRLQVNSFNTSLGLIKGKAPEFRPVRQISEVRTKSDSERMEALGKNLY